MQVNNCYRPEVMFGFGHSLLQMPLANFSCIINQINSGYLHPTHISLIERGLGKVSLGSIEKLVAGLGVRVGGLLWLDRMLGQNKIDIRKPCSQMDKKHCPLALISLWIHVIHDH